MCAFFTFGYSGTGSSVVPGESVKNAEARARLAGDPCLRSHFVLLYVESTAGADAWADAPPHAPVAPDRIQSEQEKVASTSGFGRADARTRTGGPLQYEMLRSRRTRLLTLAGDRTAELLSRWQTSFPLAPELAHEDKSACKSAFLKRSRKPFRAFGSDEGSNPSPSAQRAGRGAIAPCPAELTQVSLTVASIHGSPPASTQVDWVEWSMRTTGERSRRSRPGAQGGREALRSSPCAPYE
jgi:hypothetical protein